MLDDIIVWPPNAKAVTGNVFPLLLVHIVQKYSRTL